MTDTLIDNTLLKVKGDKSFRDEEDKKVYIKKLASAVLTVVMKHGCARLKVVGASSNNNATKSVIIARGEASKKGMNLVCYPSFDQVIFDDVEKTAMVITVYDEHKENSHV